MIAEQCRWLSVCEPTPVHLNRSRTRVAAVPRLPPDRATMRVKRHESHSETCQCIRFLSYSPLVGSCIRRAVRGHQGTERFAHVPDQARRSGSAEYMTPFQFRISPRSPSRSQRQDETTKGWAGGQRTISSSKKELKLKRAPVLFGKVEVSIKRGTQTVCSGKVDVGSQWEP